MARVPKQRPRHARRRDGGERLPRARRERSGRAGARGRTRPWLWVVCGALAVPVGLALLGGAVSAWRELPAYRRATPCDAEPSADCVAADGAVVANRRVSRGKGDEYVVTLRLDRPELAPPHADVRVELPAPDEVFPELVPGRRVTVRVWHERVTRIEVPRGPAAETNLSPETDVYELAAVSLLLLSGGVMALASGNDLRRRYGWARAPYVAGEMAHGRVSRAVASVAVALLPGAALALFLVTTFDVYRPVAFVPVPLCAVALWLLARRARLQFDHPP